MDLLEVMMTGNNHRNLKNPMKKVVFFTLSLMFSFCVLAQNENINDLCPIRRFIETSSPTGFSEKFEGDTIQFSVPNSDNVLFETFRLLTPDTLWIKEKPKNKLPQEHKHFKLITHFKHVPGWGVNSHRQYTPGSALESSQFILRGSHSETVPYLGTTNFVLLEDVSSGNLIKWDVSKNENKGLIIFSPSILRHLSLMNGLDFIIEQDDSSFIDGKCTDVTFSIGVKPNLFNVTIDSDFATSKGKIPIRNWNQRFFLKKDASKLHIDTN